MTHTYSMPHVTETRVTANGAKPLTSEQMTRVIALLDARKARV